VEEINRASTTRNFKITDEAGVIIGGASSIWAMMDIKTRRAIDLKTLPHLNAFVTGEPSIITKPTRLQSIDGIENAVEEHTVRYTDIDFNQHANSMKYVEWLLDRFSLNWHKTHLVKRFEINFLHEALYGETLGIYQQQELLTSLFEIKKQDGQPVCKMKLEWT
jgi:acyl-ACP thioesterase